MNNTAEAPQEISMEVLLDQPMIHEIPFEVPQNVDVLQVFYTYKRYEKYIEKSGDEYNRELNVVDLGVYDEQGHFRGTSGSERAGFLITENEATPGYIRGPVNAGKWTVVLGASKVQTDGCQLNLCFRFSFKQGVLLKGDLHVHSIHSDGRYTVDELLSAARLHGLDYVFLTDHNTYAQNEQLPCTHYLAVMPGMEWTMFHGHANFLGVQNPVQRFIADDKVTAVRTLDEARQNGAFVVLAHPFDTSCPWKWGFDVPFDAVEVWNGPFKPTDYKAVQWWHERLCQGERIPIVGGSDFHRDELFRIVGTPTTFLYSDSRGCSDIMAALRKGRAFIGFSPDSPQIALSALNAIMGDCLAYAGGVKGVVRVAGVSRGDRIVLISDQGQEMESVVEDQSVKQLEFVMEKRKFYRVEVWREFLPGITLLAALSNPLYIR